MCERRAVPSFDDREKKERKERTKWSTELLI